MYNPNCNFELSPLARLQAIAKKAIADCNIPVEFPEELSALTSAELSPAPCQNRRDLRDVPCLTIDSADTKDMDDAVALQRVDEGYLLSVHIADVAAYVTLGSILDEIALERGTSIYLPHQTIPMLPAILSDDLCSLNPGRDRNALSLLMVLNIEGDVLRSWFTKSLISSRVKGVYSEIDGLLQGTCDASVRQKYAGITSSLFEMKTLANKLRARRVQTGAHIVDQPNLKYVIEGRDIKPLNTSRGQSEIIIEEFMVLANRLVAEYFQENNLPAIYRVQSKRQTLAHYEANELGHAELALKHYAHFTSPIRRLADMKTHQILTAHLGGMGQDALQETFGESTRYAAERATRCENRSDQINKACNNFCLAHVLVASQNTELKAKVVGHTYDHRPLFLLDCYPVRVAGAAGLTARAGQRVALKLVVTDSQKGKVEVRSIRPLQQAA